MSSDGYDRAPAASPQMHELPDLSFVFNLALDPDLRRALNVLCDSSAAGWRILASLVGASTSPTDLTADGVIEQLGRWLFWPDALHGFDTSEAERLYGAVPSCLVTWQKVKALWAVTDVIFARERREFEAIYDQTSGPGRGD